jgi:hypothetical protein
MPNKTVKLTVEPYPGMPLKRHKMPQMKSKPVRRMKPHLWTLKVADKKFSDWIRARDGRCMHPIGCESKTMLQNSHYIGRARKSVRFDPDNCITLCWFHHYKSKDLGFEYQKQTLDKHGYDGQYTLFMKQRLGPLKFYQLRGRALEDMKQNDAIKRFMDTFSQLNTHA